MYWQDTITRHGPGKQRQEADCLNRLSLSIHDKCCQNPRLTRRTTVPRIQTNVLFYNGRGNSSKVMILSKLSVPVNRVSKEGRVTSENAKETVRRIGIIIIISTTTVQGATNIIPVRALVFMDIRSTRSA